MTDPSRAPSLFARLRRDVAAERPVALATVIDGAQTGAKLLVTPDAVAGTLGDDDLDRVVTRDVRGALAVGSTGVRHYGAAGEARREDVSVFIECFAPPPRLVLFGAVDFAGALVRLGVGVGYRVVVCDARATFATAARFPEAHEVVVDWPHRYLDGIGADLGPRDAVCVLTHDPKFDVPAIIAALATDVGYLGAMGSRRTTKERNQRLRVEGVTDEQLTRLMAPIGLDLGGRTPEETAISILAEIIAHRTGRHVPSLRDADGDIHAD